MNPGIRNVLTFAVSPTRFTIERFKDKVRDKNKAIHTWNVTFRSIMWAIVVALLFAKTGAVVRHMPFYLGYFLLWLIPLSRVNELGLAFYQDAFQRFTMGTTPVGRLKLLLWSYVEVAVQFGILYFCMPDGYFRERFSSVIEAIYFSVITITTAGYGDITPKQPLSQLACVYELGVGFVLVIFAFGSYLTTVRTSTDETD